MPLTGPDNPLLCRYFCYYLKLVYDNEMFTTGDTLNFSYGGLGEEIWRRKWQRTPVFLPRDSRGQRSSILA